MGHTLMVGGVILGAVIAAFAFGMAAGVTRMVAMAVSATQSGDDIVPTCTGGEDSPSLLVLDVAAEDGTAVTGSFANTQPAAGDTLTIPTAGSRDNDHVAGADSSADD